MFNNPTVLVKSLNSKQSSEINTSLLGSFQSNLLGRLKIQIKAKRNQMGLKMPAYVIVYLQYEHKADCDHG